MMLGLRVHFYANQTHFQEQRHKVTRKWLIVAGAHIGWTVFRISRKIRFQDLFSALFLREAILKSNNKQQP